MKSLRYFIFTTILVSLFSGCGNNDDAAQTIDLNPRVVTQEDRSVSFMPVPITSDVILSSMDQPEHGDIINAGLGQYLYVPGRHFNGLDPVAFTLSDGRQGTITFAVTPVNDTPLAGDDTIVSIDGAKVAIAVLSNDVEFDEGDTLRISDITQPSQGQVTDNGDGTINFTPPVNFVGEVRFRYTVSDIASASDSADVSIFVISGDARLTSIDLTPAAVTLAYGATVQFKADGVFADISNADITSVAEWVSSDSTLLSFGDKPALKGFATAKASGAVTVTASFKGISVSTSVQILSKVPTAPTSVSGKYLGNGVIEVNWQAVTDADHYNLYWFTANRGTQVISHVTGPFNHANSTPEITYYYTVRAVNADGLEGKSSTQIAVKPQAQPTKPVPAPPEGGAIGAVNNQVNLNWQAVDNADYYVVYWSNTLPVERTTANRIEVTGTTFIHDNLDSGLQYHYVVTTSTEGIESDPGVVLSATLPPVAPALTAVAGDARITLSWNAVMGADGYRIYWSTTSPVERDESRRFDVAADEPLTMIHSGLNNGDAYSYLIVAVNAGGESPSALASAVPIRTQPQNVRVTLDFGAIRLSWDPVDNARYNVYWSTTTPVDIAADEVASVNRTEYLHIDVLPARNYYFVVTAVIDGVESEPSSPEMLITLPPDAPEVTARAGNQRVSLTWDGVAGADGYTIYWYEAGDTFVILLNSIFIDTNFLLNTYVHETLTNGSTYYYQVIARFDTAESDSSVVSAIPRDYTVTKTEDTADGSCDSDCSLREAIIAANTKPGKETIIVSPGTYSLSIAGAGEDLGLTGDLDISDDFILLGDDAATTVIDANGLDRALDVSANTGYIEGITVRNGLVTGNELGGGIRHSTGELRIDNSIIASNRSELYGGGIANRGDTACVLADGDGGLGALGGGCPVLTINASVLSDNCAAESGSAIEHYGLLTLNTSTVSANGLVDGVCSDTYGVIHTQYGVTFINQSTLINNTAGTVLSEWDGTVVVSDSTIANNQTRASAVTTGAFGKLTLINSTVSGNKSDRNRFVSFGAPLEMANTLVAGNLNANNADSDCSAINVSPGSTLALTSLGNNLIGNSVTDCVSSLILLDSDLTGDAGLGAFIGNGKPGGGYYPLLTDSQAVDAGNSEYCSGIDQLGKRRPADGNADGVIACDIGAFELAAKTSRETPLLTPLAHAVGGDGMVTLMWNGVSGAVSYNLYWSENENVVPTLNNVIPLGRGAITNTYIHEALNNGSTYFYLIKAVSLNGEESQAREISATVGVSDPGVNGG